MGSFAIVTAFSSDYAVGYVASEVNKAYAERWGYDFRCEVLETSAMAERVGGFLRALPWYKIKALSAVLAERVHSHVVWIDADAAVVCPDRPLESLLSAGGNDAEDADLVVGEDLSVNSLLNSGVLLFKNSEWSRTLLDQLWRTNAQKGRLHMERPFHEQSALERMLRTSADPSLFKNASRQQRGSGHETWHSFLGGPRIKRGARTLVLAPDEINTDETRGGPARFCWHALGLGATKVIALLRALRRHGVALPPVALDVALLRPRAAEVGDGVATRGGRLTDALLTSELAARLGRSPFRNLDLDGSALTEQSAKVLAMAIGSAECSVCSVRLGGNRKLLGGGEGGDLRGLELLLGRAETARRLVRLELCFCGLGDRGAALLHRVLSARADADVALPFPALRVLDLCGNGIGASGVVLLTTAVERRLTPGAELLRYYAQHLRIRRCSVFVELRIEVAGGLSVRTDPLVTQEEAAAVLATAPIGYYGSGVSPVRVRPDDE